jgi:hypothetical protein
MGNQSHLRESSNDKMFMFLPLYLVHNPSCPTNSASYLIPGGQAFLGISASQERGQSSIIANLNLLTTSNTKEHPF